MDLLPVASDGCLPQLPWGLLLMACTPLSRTIPEWVSLQQLSHNYSVHQAVFLFIHLLFPETEMNLLKGKFSFSIIMVP
jgi:hypothetical protein